MLSPALASLSLALTSSGLSLGAVLAAFTLTFASSRLPLGLTFTSSGLTFISLSLTPLPLLHARVAVPGGARVIDIDGPVHDEVVPAPIDPTAPKVRAGRPPRDRIAGTERKARRDQAGADIAGSGKVVGRIQGIGPRAVRDRGVVVRHINRVR